MSRHFKLTLAYDGTAYAGWQVQPGAATVQGTLEATIEKITGRPSRVLASGGPTPAFTPWDRWPRFAAKALWRPKCCKGP